MTPSGRVMIAWVAWYVLQGIKTLVAKQDPTTRIRISRWYWLVNLLLPVAMVALPAANIVSPLTQWLPSIFLTLLITKLTFVVVLFLEDIFRFFRWMGGLLLPRNPDRERRYIPGRRKFISQAGVVLAAIPFASFIYGMVKGKYDYKVHRQTLYFKGLPESFDGFTITQISDIHSGSFDNAEAVQRGIDLINAQKSDLFVFTGDLVNNTAAEIEPWLDHFNQLKAPFGQFSVLGNHDYGEYFRWNSEEEKAANLDKLKSHHASLGYRLLLDEHVTLEKNGEKITLVGVENWGKGFIQKGDLDRALAGTEPGGFKVLLSHDPSHWEEVVKKAAEPVHLTLAGHTHGMQFGIETQTVKWSPVKYRYRNWAGLAQENDRYLYVNRGFGFIGFSGRVGIWPEITVLELRKA